MRPSPARIRSFTCQPIWDVVVSDPNGEGGIRWWKNNPPTQAKQTPAGPLFVRADANGHAVVGLSAHVSVRNSIAPVDQGRVRWSVSRSDDPEPQMTGDFSGGEVQEVNIIRTPETADFILHVGVDLNGDKQLAPLERAVSLNILAFRYRYELTSLGGGDENGKPDLPSRTMGEYTKTRLGSAARFSIRRHADLGAGDSRMTAFKFPGNEIVRLSFGGSATPGGDYIPPEPFVVIPQGEEQTELAVYLLNNSRTEPIEHISIKAIPHR